MDLTLNNLLSFLQTEFPSSAERFTPSTVLRERSIDGDDAVELLLLLEKHFLISFEHFYFQDYFLEEIEISRSLVWFGLKRVREIKTELTVLQLFEFMTKQIKR
jgi:hypothetical protein